MDERRFQSMLKQFETTYRFTFCNKEDVDALLKFVDKYWKNNHIIATSRKMLDWQYYNQEHKRYNFILAYHKQTDELHGILGFIPTSLFDKDIQTPMRWGAIWKVRDDVPAKGLGLALKLYMYINVPMPYAGGIGLSTYSKAINTKMGEEMGILKHYFMLNPYSSEYHLADNVMATDLSPSFTEGVNTLERYDEKAFFGNKKLSRYLLPYKSMNYYIKRYFEHPFYDYECYAIKDSSNNCEAVFFTRVCSWQSAKCIMIVDFLGNENMISETHNAFITLLKNFEAEYISFYEYGLKDDNLRKAGFIEIHDSNAIIPLYYEPFLSRNIDIDYHYYNNPDVEHMLYFFKGDADQDRPNAITEV